MSRSFNGTSDYLEATFSPVVSYPFTLSCQFNISSLAATENTAFQVSEATDGCSLQIMIRSSGKIRARSADSGGFAASAETSGTITTNTWNQVTAVFTSDTDRTVYLNGADKVNNTTSVVPHISSLNRTTVGAWAISSSRFAFFPGLIAEAGIWNVSLTDAEAASLGKGVSPLLIRPTALVFYAPIIGRTSPEINLKGAGLTVSGAVVGDHPRVFYPGVPIIGKGTANSYTMAAAVGSFALTGISTTLTKSGNTLSAVSGTFALTGNAVNLKRALRMAASQGSFTLTGISASLTFAAAAASTVSATSQQTMLGWEAAAQIGHEDNAITEVYEYPSTTLPNYLSALQTALYDLGLNRVRLEIRFDDVNATGYDWDGNNNAIQPSTASAPQWHFERLSHSMDSFVTAWRNYLSSIGENLYINICFVDFRTGGYKLEDTASEFAFYTNKVVDWFFTTYGYLPDSLEMLEPDNSAANSNWTAAKLANGIVAANSLLVSNGYSGIKWKAPTVTSLANATTWIADMKSANASVTALIDEYSYHLYSGTNTDLANLKTVALADGKTTAMLESHAGFGGLSADHIRLYDDLTIGYGSSWEQYTITYPYPAQTDDGGKYFIVNTTTWAVSVCNRTKYLRHYFKYVKRGAVKKATTDTGTNYKTLAFQNPNNCYTAVVKCTGAASVVISGLPAATYAIRYTLGDGVNAPSAYDQTLSNQTITSGQSISFSMAGAGIATVYDVNTFLVNHTMTAASGTFGITGNAVGLKRGLKLTASQGSYAVTGNAVNLRSQRLLTALPSSFILTGNAAALNTAGHFTLIANVGSFSFTGNNVNLRAQRVLIAAQTSFVLTGIAANFPSSQDAILNPPLKINLSSGIKEIEINTGKRSVEIE